MSFGLNKGLIGFGSNQARGEFDNVQLRVAAPEATYDGTVDFAGATAPLGTPTAGTWTQGGGYYVATPTGTPALVTGRIVPQALRTTSWLQLTATLKTAGTAGIVFDYYSANDYKFAVMDVTGGRVYLGHVSPLHGTAIDAIYTKALSGLTSYVMELNLKGASASITLNGEFMVSTGYNAALVDGAFGLVAQNGTATYDTLRIRSDDESLVGVTAPTSTTAPPSSPPSATVGDVTVTEGNAGTGVAVVTITLSRAVVAGETVKVNYALTAGSATAGSDYAATTGTLTFGAGEISKTVSVIVYGDTTVEPDETLSLVLSTPVGMTVADGTGVITITNDDVPPPPTLSISSVSVTEGNKGAAPTATVTLTLSRASTTTVTVTVSDLRTGTATSGTDYNAFATRTVTFAPGTLTQTVTLTVVGDTTKEANETVLLGLSAASGATIATGTGTVTIVNDDSKMIAASVGPGTTSRVSARQVNRVLRAALAYWRAHGATARQLAGIRVLQTSMAGTDLAEAVGRTIHLDVDAAGWGWSTAARGAAGRMHLFTVLVHEIGHMLGLSHADHGVMEAVLRPGQVLAVPLSRRARR